MGYKFRNFSSFLIAFLLFAGLSTGIQGVSAQKNIPDEASWGKRGQTAVDQLGPHLDELASKYNLEPATLQERLLTDPNLWVDNQGRLVFLDEILPPAGAVETASFGQPQVPFPNDQTFLLHSYPGGSKVIYLDFTGHVTTGTFWNDSFGDPIVSQPFDLDGSPSTWSDLEMERIQAIWQRVAEDYLPYGVDVTTQDPGIEGLRKTSPGDAVYGQRVVISPTNWFNLNAGGVAYIGSFNWNTDTPTFVFSAQLEGGHEKSTSEAASHETGHTVGLYHDGIAGGDAYYAGHGDWAPIMGVGYYKEIVQFSKGEYANANNPEDDLEIMTGYGFTYRADDHGNAKEAATSLTIQGGMNASGTGIIERTTDKDYFSFQTGIGTVSFTLNPGPRSPNLDILVELYDANGSLVTSSNPSTLYASISTFLAAGTYYLAVDGIGAGEPNTGYSDYASLGEFSLSGTIIDPNVLQPPQAVASAIPTSGDMPLAVAFTGSGSKDNDGTIVSYAWDFGDGGSAYIADPSHTYIAAGVYTAVLTVTDNDNLTGSDSVTITVTGCPLGQWKAEYFNNTTLSGTPFFTRCEGEINYEWGSNGPGNGVMEDNFSVRWTGRFAFNAAGYTFSVTGDKGIRMLVDEVKILDGWENQTVTTFQATQPMSAGTHGVVVEYYHDVGYSIVKVAWWQVDQMSSVCMPLVFR